jgi:hypothetical protein
VIGTAIATASQKDIPPARRSPPSCRPTRRGQHNTRRY